MLLNLEYKENKQTYQYVEIAFLKEQFWTNIKIIDINVYYYKGLFA